MSALQVYKGIAADGLWKSNPGLVQILGMCPLMATSTSVVNGIGLGLATALTMTISNALVASIRSFVRPEIRIPVFVVIIACVVTAIELAMKGYFHELYVVLGIFIPLIVTNCIVIARAEAFASKQPILPAAFDGLMMGLGFMAVLVTLGALREMIGQGTLFAQAHLMFGDSARWLTINFGENYQGFLLAVLPPGAFLALACLIALKNVIDQRMARHTDPAIAIDSAPVTTAPAQH